MLIFVLLGLSLIQPSIGQDHVDVFSSIDKLIKLTQTQSKVVGYMKEFVEVQYEKLKTAEK